MDSDLLSEVASKDDFKRRARRGITNRTFSGSWAKALALDNVGLSLSRADNPLGVQLPFSEELRGLGDVFSSSLPEISGFSRRPQKCEGAGGKGGGRAPGEDYARRRIALSAGTGSRRRQPP